MTDKEKIASLIIEELNLVSEIARVVGVGRVNKIADHLIANGVTVPKRGHWVIRSSGRGRETTNWAECSECHVCGSPVWKVCPVCETRMEENDRT